MKQLFKDIDEQRFETLPAFPGSSISVLSEPVPEGSIHRLKMDKDTTIPVHTHPSDEYVYVLSGTLTTNGRECHQGCFWYTPAGTKQGPHVAQTDVEIVTIRLGPMGEFEGGEK